MSPALGANAAQFPHQPVMAMETLSALNPRAGGHYVDGTLGAGGHSVAILNACAPDGRLTAFEIDPDARAIAAPRLTPFANRARLIADSYAAIASYIPPSEGIDGFLLDLGVSSMQLDQAERGFSFLQDGPLDMRFNPTQGVSAADLVNQLPEEELAHILWEFGEERRSRVIAAAICRARKTQPFRSTGQLAQLIAGCAGGAREKIHPATRSFQALRIAVNGELDAARRALEAALPLLNPGGRMVVISFHSLEDRIVKQFFRRESRDCLCPPEQMVCSCAHKATLKEINRHPILAGEAEIELNPRARSAKMRVAEKRKTE